MFSRSVSVSEEKRRRGKKRLMMVYATLADKGATNTDANGGRRGDIINYCIVLFRRAAKTQLKNIAVHGLRIVGG